MTPRAHPPIIGRFRSIADLEDMKRSLARTHSGNRHIRALRDACRRRQTALRCACCLPARRMLPCARSATATARRRSPHRQRAAWLGGAAQGARRHPAAESDRRTFCAVGSSGGGHRHANQPVAGGCLHRPHSRETGVQVMVALGPAPGSQIWSKAVRVAEQVPSIHTLSNRHGRGTRRVDASPSSGPPASGPCARKFACSTSMESRAGLGRIAHVRARI